jgi:glycosyltransferase involved in cell wall biosynthesis
MKNKILFIGSFKKPKNGHYGGVYFASTTLRDGLIKEGFQIIEMDTTLKDIVETRVYKRLPDIISRQFKFLYTILLNVKAKQIFIFLSGSGSYVDKFLPILLSKLLRKKIIIFPVSGHLISDIDNRKFLFFINRVFNLTDKIVCQSSYWEDYFSSRKVEKNKLLVIENWVDDLKIKESINLNYPEFKVNDKITFKIVIVSRIEKAKGVDDIIELGQRLQNKLDFSIFVYGAGSYQKEFVDSIKSNKLENVIFFKGWLEKEKMLETINSHHLAVFSSKTEGYPNGLLDYIFSKIPILSSDIPMLRAVGKSNMAYYKFGNTEEMAKIVEEIYSDYELSILKAQNLFKIKVIENCTDTSIKKIKNILL